MNKIFGNVEQLGQAPTVYFVDDDRPVCALPLFVTRTSLNTLLSDDSGDDIGIDLGSWVQVTCGLVGLIMQNSAARI